MNDAATAAYVLRVNLCPICNTIFENQAAHVCNPPPILQPFYCPNCPRGFNTYHALHMHRSSRQIHCRKNTDECIECGVVFHDNLQLQLHKGIGSSASQHLIQKYTDLQEEMNQLRTASRRNVGAPTLLAFGNSSRDLIPTFNPIQLPKILILETEEPQYNNENVNGIFVAPLTNGDIAAIRNIEAA